MNKKRIRDFVLYIIIGVVIFSAFLLYGLYTTCCRPPTKESLYRSNLKSITLALNIYAYDYDGYFPDSYESFTSLYPHYIKDPKIFWCPSDVNNKKPPNTINNWEIDGENSSRISYEYILGLSVNDVDAVIVRDNTPANHEGKGVWAGYVDGHVEWIPVESEEK